MASLSLNSGKEWPEGRKHTYTMAVNHLRCLRLNDSRKAYFCLPSTFMIWYVSWTTLYLGSLRNACAQAWIRYRILFLTFGSVCFWKYRKWWEQRNSCHKVMTSPGNRKISNSQDLSCDKLKNKQKTDKLRAFRPCWNVAPAWRSRVNVLNVIRLPGQGKRCTDLHIIASHQ